MNAMTEPLHLLSNSHLDALEEETIFIRSEEHTSELQSQR